MNNSSKSNRPVLVAEDNIINQRLVELLLAHINIPCKLVRNGKECVEEALRNDYSLIFMDIHMPIMDGFEATQLIRKASQGDSQPYIIALTASDVDAKTCIESGMNSCVRKPLDLQKIRAIFSTIPQHILVKA